MSGLSAYHQFLTGKALLDPPSGINEPRDLPECLFDFQAAVTGWALKRGRAALFAGTGLGKSLMELSWAQAVHRETGGDVLHLAPLAVSAQLGREAAKFGLAARVVRAGRECEPGTNITNFQKLDHFDMSRFAGVILDESSILKSTDGHYRTRLIEECAGIPFRLAATATPAPNDFMELGNHAEFLGVMSYTDMLATFFAHDGGDTRQWRLKGHAEDAFWRWMASWAVMLRRPSDLGYEDGAYRLPPLRQFEHMVSAPPAEGDFGLFAPVAVTLKDRLAARRDTVSQRIAKAASLTPADRPCVWWCNLNAESEGLTATIPGAVEVRGSDDPDEKERKLVAFSEGRIRVLVTKPSIAGFGMNWQHCADTGFVGLTDSFEQIYQATRRFWRFGQTKPVNVHFVVAEAEGAVLANLRRKEADAERMAAAMVRHMAGFSTRAVRGLTRERGAYAPALPMQLPDWIGEAA